MDKEQQFKQILEANQDRIYRICCCYLRDEEERRDVFQNVLLQVWKNLGTFAGRSSISTWLYRITVNVCLGHLRLAERRKHIFSEEPAAENSLAIADLSAAEAPGEREHDLRRLYRCVQQLPDFEKTLVSLFLEDATTAEMAEVLGISEGNVRVKLHRVKKALKELWEKCDYEPA